MYEGNSISEGGRCLINNQARSSVKLIEESLILIINAPAFLEHVVGFCTHQKLGVVMWQVYKSEILRQLHVSPHSSLIMFAVMTVLLVYVPDCLCSAEPLDQATVDKIRERNKAYLI